MTYPFSYSRRIALLRAAIIPLLATSCSRYPPSKAPAPALSEGIHTAEGTVTLNGVPVSAGDPVPDGAQLQTESSSRAIFIRGRNAFLLRERSQVAFFEGNSKPDQIKLVEGALLSVFTPGRVTLRTPVAELGIRGTGCYIESYPDKSYICLCYGKGDIHSAITGELLMQVDTIHHDSPFNIYPSGELMEPMSAINHTDDELILLEALVGREPDFVGQLDEWDY